MYLSSLLLFLSFSCLVCTCSTMAPRANFLPRRHGRYRRTRLEEMLRCFPGLSQHRRHQLSGQIFRLLRSRAFVRRLINGSDTAMLYVAASILASAGLRFTHVGLGFNPQLESFLDWYARYVLPNTTLRTCTYCFVEQKLPCLSLFGITRIVFLFQLRNRRRQSFCSIFQPMPTNRFHSRTRKKRTMTMKT